MKDSSKKLKNFKKLHNSSGKGVYNITIGQQSYMEHIEFLKATKRYTL